MAATRETPVNQEDKVQQRITTQLQKRAAESSEMKAALEPYNALAPYSPYLPTIQEAYADPKLMISDHLPLRGEYDVGGLPLRIVTWNVMDPRSPSGYAPASSIAEYRIANIRQVLKGMQTNPKDQADVVALQEEFFSISDYADLYGTNLLKRMCADLGPNWDYILSNYDGGLVTFYNKDVVALDPTKTVNEVERWGSRTSAQFVLKNGERATIQNMHLEYNESIEPTEKRITDFLRENKTDGLTVCIGDMNAHIYHKDQEAVTQAAPFNFRNYKGQGAASTDGCFYRTKATGPIATKPLTVINPYAYTEAKLERKEAAVTFTDFQKDELSSKRMALHVSDELTSFEVLPKTTILEYQQQLRALSKDQSLLVRQAIGFDHKEPVVRIVSDKDFYDTLKEKVSGEGIRFHTYKDKMEEEHYQIDVNLNKMPAFDVALHAALQPLPAKKGFFELFSRSQPENPYAQLPEAFKQLAKQLVEFTHNDVKSPKETYEKKLVPALERYREINPTFKLLADIININCLIQFPFGADEVLRMKQHIPNHMPLKLVRASRLLEGLEKYITLMENISEAKLKNDDMRFIRVELQQLGNNIEHLASILGKDLQKLSICYDFANYDFADESAQQQLQVFFERRSKKSDELYEKQIDALLVKVLHCNDLLNGVSRIKPTNKAEKGAHDLHAIKVSPDMQAQLIEPLKIMPQEMMLAPGKKR